MTTDERRFAVVEIFGPTLQGEGALAGVPSHFIRFGGCDFSCHWCDSAHAVLPENVRQASKMLTDEIIIAVLELRDLSADWVTLSGGNPALHDLGKLVEALHSLQFKVAVETQGSMWKDWLSYVDQLTVSPKPPSSRMSNEYLPTFMKKAIGVEGKHYTDVHSERATICLKVPVYDEDDLDFALGVHWSYPDVPFYISIVTEMGGLRGDFADGRVDTAESLLTRYQRVVQDVLRRGVSDVRILPQLHYLIWGNRTGV